MTQEQILADVARALRECFPDRADVVLREIEARFTAPALVEDPDAGTAEVFLHGTDAYAWYDRSGWGMAFEFVRAMRRLADAGYRGDVRIRIHARREPGAPAGA